MLVQKASAILNSPNRPGLKRKRDEDDVPTLFELCEGIVRQTEPPLKRKRGRPRIKPLNYQPKSLRVLCEEQLQIPKRRGRKKKWPGPQSPLPLKELCKNAVENSNPEKTVFKKRGRKRKVRNPPTLKQLCKRILGEEDDESEEEKIRVSRSQRRRKFNKKWLGFADVPSVMKPSYWERMKRRNQAKRSDDRREDVNVRRIREHETTETLVVKRTVLKPIKKNYFTNIRELEPLHRFPALKTYNRKPKRNGNICDTKTDNYETIYHLQVSDSSKNNVLKSEININFTNLLREIQKVSLPSSEWKIKIILYNQQISQIVFSNKSSPERCVNIYRNSKYYDVTFDKTFVVLLGSPRCIESLSDLSVLLQIVHALQEDDPVLQYVRK